ncbi:MAG: GAF domain-containing protein, partial [Chloroflexota bacterium]|nr:GAF domain-containing protein [Chloroflexota bacterium]
MKIFKLREFLLGRYLDDQGITLRNWRERTFTIVVSIGAAVGAIAYIASAISQFGQHNWLMLSIVTVAYFWLLGITLLKQIPYSLRAGSFILMLYVLGIATGLTKASVGDSRIWLITASILAVVFVGGRAGLISASISFATWLMMGLLFKLDILNYPYTHILSLIQPDNFSLWVNTGISALVASATITASIATVLNNLNTSLQQSHALTDELEEKTNQLQEQAKTLTHRSQTLETSVRINRTISSILDPDQLLYQAAKLVCEEFDLLHVGIFLTDKSGDAVSLQASSGGGGKTVPASGYRIPLGAGLINWAITNSQPRAVLENDESNPPPLQIKLSDTRSYAVLPLRRRDETLGAIVLQSQQPHIFGPNMLTTLQIMSDQIASLLDTAQLFIERETALEAERRSYSEMTRSAWKEILQTRASSGYRRDKRGITSIDSSVKIRPANVDLSTQTIPIQVRGQVIGYIDAKKSSGDRWALAEKELLENLAERLESALDTARLYEETQQRAAEE